MQASSFFSPIDKIKQKNYILLYNICLATVIRNKLRAVRNETN